MELSILAGTCRSHCRYSDRARSTRILSGAEAWYTTADPASTTSSAASPPRQRQRAISTSTSSAASIR